ncbi:MAG: hypothetical protein L6R42_003609 [Xanthoria sp. 1 TBL-2021]|nr:MAG: hypothetical protein L6R42_003609 [Xanthoria sp. 1 TBL-2021]
MGNDDAAAAAAGDELNTFLAGRQIQDAAEIPATNAPIGVGAVAGAAESTLPAVAPPAAVPAAEEPTAEEPTAEDPTAEEPTAEKPIAAAKESPSSIITGPTTSRQPAVEATSVERNTSTTPPTPSPSHPPPSTQQRSPSTSLSATRTIDPHAATAPASTPRIAISTRTAGPPGYIIRGRRTKLAHQLTSLILTQ